MKTKAAADIETFGKIREKPGSGFVKLFLYTITAFPKKCNSFFQNFSKNFLKCEKTHFRGEMHGVSHVTQYITTETYATQLRFLLLFADLSSTIIIEDFISSISSDTKKGS